MAVVQRCALPHLIAANSAEITRLKDIDQLDEDNWPEEFDPNDVHLHILVGEQLQAASTEAGEEIELHDWKGLRFLARLIPQYVADNQSVLPQNVVAALATIHAP